MTVNAVDCTGLNPTQIADLVKNGVKTVGRYLSQSSWKGLTLGEVANIKAAGLQIFSIYESNPTKASYFSADKGKSDALDAVSLAKCVGQPEGTAIYFTVDYDAQTCDLKAILSYFQAVKANLSGYKVGAYGSFTVLNYLHENNAADYWFQTVAWSNGNRCNFLNLFQYQCDKQLAGVNVDFDNLEKDDIGAWGQVQPDNGHPIIAQVRVITGALNIRQGPGTQFPVLEVAQKGKIFNVTGNINDWHEVILDNNGHKGYAFGNKGTYLELVR